LTDGQTKEPFESGLIGDEQTDTSRLLTRKLKVGFDVPRKSQQGFEIESQLEKPFWPFPKMSSLSLNAGANGIQLFYRCNL